MFALAIFVCVLLLGKVCIHGECPYIEREAGNETGIWGYARVRQEAHLFWWLKYTTHSDGYLNRPWIIWIQGGPGRPGSGFGNYLMFGPEDTEGRARNSSWVENVSVMFVDSPIGCGYSYMEEGYSSPNKSTHVAQDLVGFLQAFLRIHTEFQELPLYIFGQSYGGKMGVVFAHQLEAARRQRRINCQLKGVAIGNGFVSPFDTSLAWPSLLSHISVIGHSEAEAMTSRIDHLRTRLDSGELHKNVSRDWEGVLVSPEMSRVNVYNFLQPASAMNMYRRDVTDFMNGTVREQLGIIPENITWINKDSELYNAMRDEEFLISVVDLVDELLTMSEVNVIVYSGQLDVICSTQGTLEWVDSLQWCGMDDYRQSTRRPLMKPETDIVEMYVKAHAQLKFYWVMNAGHVVPADVPETALRMLDRITDDVDA